MKKINYFLVTVFSLFNTGIVFAQTVVHSLELNELGYYYCYQGTNASNEVTNVNAPSAWMNASYSAASGLQVSTSSNAPDPWDQMFYRRVPMVFDASRGLSVNLDISTPWNLSFYVQTPDGEQEYKISATDNITINGNIDLKTPLITKFGSGVVNPQGNIAITKIGIFAGKYKKIEFVAESLVSIADAPNRINELFVNSADVWTTDQANYSISNNNLNLSVSPGMSWGVAWKTYTYNVDSYPWIAVYMDNINSSWAMKVNKGDGVDVDLPISKAKVYGTKLYCWNVKEITGWTGDITGEVQCAMITSNGTLSVDWIKSFSSQKEIEILPEANMAAPGLFFEFKTLEGWYGKDNATISIVDNEKLKLQMGGSTYYGLTVKDAVTYDLNAYEVVAVKLDEKSAGVKDWLLKMYDGSKDNILKTSTQSPEELNGSLVYAWNLKELWGSLGSSGIKNSNIQLAIENGSNGDYIVVDWIRSFKDFNTFYSYIDGISSGVSNPTFDGKTNIRYTVSQGILRILNETYSNQPIMLYDARGSKVKYVEGTNQINISDIAKGIYILSTKGFNNTKIIIQ